MLRFLSLIPLGADAADEVDDEAVEVYNDELHGKLNNCKIGKIGTGIKLSEPFCERLAAKLAAAAAAAAELPFIAAAAASEYGDKVRGPSDG